MGTITHKGSASIKTCLTAFHGNKEVSQQIENLEIPFVQGLNDEDPENRAYEWFIRRMIAMYILEYGYDALP
jgi:hypothetical protein